jgi:hypothetical protein
VITLGKLALYGGLQVEITDVAAYMYQYKFPWLTTVILDYEGVEMYSLSASQAF